MNFTLTEEHKAVQEAARNFAEAECKPGVIERDTEQKVGFNQLNQKADLLLFWVCKAYVLWHWD